MRFAPWLLWTGLIAGGFALGGIMFSRHLPRLLLKTDVCRLSDDANPGAGNVFSHCGWKIGLLCLFCDLFKGFLPVFLAGRFVEDGPLLFAAVMAAPVVGHAIAPFDREKGGKCIAAAFGVLLGLIPRSYIVFLLAFLYIFFSTVFKINPNRVRSIVTFLIFGITAFTLSLCTGRASIAFGCAAVSSVVIFKHSRFCLPEKEAQAESHSAL